MTKNKEIDFLIADKIELSSFRDEISSMEHPFFSLRGGCSKIKKYKNGNVIITVKSTIHCVANIFDKDLWIYFISKMQELINNNKKISRTIIFTPYDFFITTNRQTGGRAYKDFKKSLSRLANTRIETNIVYSKSKKELIGFGLIDSWYIFEEKKGNIDIGMIEVTLSNWLYNALQKKRILKISSEYFSIRKALNRRIYEIARKHCGRQKEFIITLKKLHLKTGSTSVIKMFRFNIKKLSLLNDLPEYNIFYDRKSDLVIFNKKEPIK